MTYYQLKLKNRSRLCAENRWLLVECSIIIRAARWVIWNFIFFYKKKWKPKRGRKQCKWLLKNKINYIIHNKLKIRLRTNHGESQKKVGKGNLLRGHLLANHKHRCKSWTTLDDSYFRGHFCKNQLFLIQYPGQIGKIQWLNEYFIN